MSEWHDLQAGLRTCSISRREFFGRAAALGVSAAMATEALAQTPRRGGHLIVALDGAATGDSLDPARYTATYAQVLGMEVHDTLMELDEQGKLQPSLAESWEPRGGGSEWIVKLRKGVSFHNGRELTGPDVVYSLNHHRQKDSKSPAKSLLAPVTDIKATGKHEVTVVLESVYADLPFILADYHLVVMPEGANAADGLGAGAFVLESFQPGVRARVKRNPNYWRTDRGFLDTVETLAINDITARTSALQSGAVHLMNRIDPKTVAQLEKNPQLQIFNVTGGAHYTFCMRTDTPPYDNNDVRLALKYAVDREAMVKTVLRGYGRQGNDHPIAPADRFFAADIPQRRYDADKAKFHFKKSGYSGPIVLSVADSTFPGAVDAAQLYQASAGKAGITLQVDRVPSDGYWDNVWMKKPFTGSYWGGRPTADLMFSLVYKSDAPWNETFWKRPKFDQLLLDARKELDTARRRQMYREMQLMIHEDGGEVIAMFHAYLDGALKKVRGFPVSPVFQMGAFRAIKHIWLDA